MVAHDDWHASQAVIVAVGAAATGAGTPLSNPPFPASVGGCGRDVSGYANRSGETYVTMRVIPWLGMCRRWVFDE